MKEPRKEIIVKTSGLDALMWQSNPDEKEVAKFAGEINDRRTAMEETISVYGEGVGYGYCGGGPRR